MNASKTAGTPDSEMCSIGGRGGWAALRVGEYDALEATSAKRALNADEMAQMNELAKTRDDDVAAVTAWREANAERGAEQHDRVEQLDLKGRVIKTWANVGAARAYYGHGGNGVSRACRGLQEEAYNYGWRFEDASASVCEDEQQQSMFHDQGGGIDRRLDDVAIADPEAEGKVAAEPTKKNRRAVGGDAPPTVESSQAEAETVESDWERRKRTRREYDKRKRLEQLAFVEQFHEKGQYRGLELKPC